MEKKMKEEKLLMLETVRNNTILSKSPLPNPCNQVNSLLPVAIFWFVERTGKQLLERSAIFSETLKYVSVLDKYTTRINTWLSNLYFLEIAWASFYVCTFTRSKNHPLFFTGWNSNVLLVAFIVILNVEFKIPILLFLYCVYCLEEDLL